MRRRKTGKGASGASYAELAARYAKDAASTEPGSGDRFVAIQRGIWAICEAAGFSATDATRAGWVATLRLLDGAHTFPALGELARCLEALDRGQVDPRLMKEESRNSRRTSDDLFAMRALVEAATELRERWDEKDEVARALLKERGLPHATFDKYRKQLAETPDFAPRASFILAYGTTDPEDVLRLALAALK